MSSNKKRKINKKNNDPLINYWMHYHDSSLLPNRFVADEKKKNQMKHTKSQQHNLSTNWRNSMSSQHPIQHMNRSHNTTLN